MDISLDKKNNNEGLIKIKLNEADYQPKVEEKVKEYSKKATIKGFRPGKVPTGLIKKMYGKSILVDEVNHTLSHAITDYIRDNKLPILGEPLPNTEKAENIDWDNQKDFEFEYNVGLVDEFDVALDDSTKVTAYEIELSDDNMAETIANIRKQYGKMSNPEVSEKGDMIYGELSANDGEFKENILFPIDKVAEKLQKQFIGVKKEDVITFDLRKAIASDEELADILQKKPEDVKEMTGEFTLTASNINRGEEADMDQEFFDKIFGEGTVSTEEEFRNKVKETISENYDRETDNYLNNTIREKLIESTTIPLPDEFLKRWLLVSNEGKVTEADIEKEYELYTKELKWSLIQNKIAEKHEIKVENDDVKDKTKEFIQQQLAASGMAGQMDDNLDAFADNYLQSEKGENYMKMFNQVKTEKVLGLAKEKITIERKKVDVEQFKEIAMN